MSKRFSETRQIGDIYNLGMMFENIDPPLWKKSITTINLLSAFMLLTPLLALGFAADSAFGSNDRKEKSELQLNLFHDN